MKANEKEKGIALIIVLLMITVFTILSLSVFSFIISNTKQINKTETEMQAVDLAEMGVVYYKNAFIKNADTVLMSLLNSALQSVQTYKNTHPTVQLTNDQIKDMILTYLDNELTNTNNSYVSNIQKLQAYPQNPKIILPKKVIPDIYNSNEFFTIEWLENPQAMPPYANHTISVYFKSIGTVDQHTEEITTKIQLDLNWQNTRIIDNYLNSNGNGNTNSSIVMKNVTLPTTTNNDCSGTSITNGESCTYNHDIAYNPKKEITNVTTVINGSLDIMQGNKDIIASTIYTTGDGIFGNLNYKMGLDSSHLYVGGDAFFGNITSITNSSILVLGNVAFGSNIKDISNSLICVGGNITGGLTPNGINIFSWTQDKNSYNSAGVAAGCPRIEVNNTSTSPILPEIDGQINSNINITYN